MAPLNLFKNSKVVWNCEWEKWPSKVLEFHNPDIPNLHDVTQIDFKEVEKVDILTGGYPCQPFSSQGLRKGAEDERHLFPYVREAICTLRPKITLLENVTGHRSLGFDTVLGELAEDGFNVRWHCLRASDIGATHHRDRIFILIYDGDVTNTASLGLSPERFTIELPKEHTTTSDGGVLLSDSSTESVWGKYENVIKRWEHVMGRPAPLAVEKNKLGRPRLDCKFQEWQMGLPEGHVTDPKIGIPYGHQKKILGNGVVPQQATMALQFLLNDSNFAIMNE